MTKMPMPWQRQQRAFSIGNRYLSAVIFATKRWSIARSESLMHDGYLLTVINPCWPESFRSIMKGIIKNVIHVGSYYELSMDLYVA